ncbi:IS66 family insertion sequence element accessory protein TnpA [Paenibacillus monticola]|uniref:IS66 family insertion sequence element accessory protein TnpA n=1 Tax=Paenibacillus monticola TaxID=2666075 RepID=UPI003B83310D
MHLTRKEERRQEWAERIQHYETNGQTMKAWCDAQGVTKDTLRYWLRNLTPRSVRVAKTALEPRC